MAAREKGVLDVHELREAGLDRSAVSRRVAAGHLHRLYCGVYAVGHLALTHEAKELAAVKASGPEALRSHRSAGAARDLAFTSSPRIEVTAPLSITPKPGFVLHRTRSLAPADRTIVDSIPTTSVARTIVDLAEVLNDRRLAKAIQQAEIQGVFDLHAIDEVLTRLPGRTGRHRLARVLAAYRGGPPTTRSGRERRFWEFCERHGLPTPLSNKSRAGYELDFLWPAYGLAVEMDDPYTHDNLLSFHEDRRRDRRLAPLGIQVIRVTPQDLENETALAADFHDILASKAA